MGTLSGHSPPIGHSTHPTTLIFLAFSAHQPTVTRPSPAKVAPPSGCCTPDAAPVQPELTTVTDKGLVHFQGPMPSHPLPSPLPITASDSLAISVAKPHPVHSSTFRSSSYAIFHRTLLYGILEFFILDLPLSHFILQVFLLTACCLGHCFTCVGNKRPNLSE